MDSPQPQEIARIFSGIEKYLKRRVTIPVANSITIMVSRLPDSKSKQQLMAELKKSRPKNDMLTKHLESLKKEIVINLIPLYLDRIIAKEEGDETAEAVRNMLFQLPDTDEKVRMLKEELDKTDPPEGTNC